jgi:hypothetical protein
MRFHDPATNGLQDTLPPMVWHCNSYVMSLDKDLIKSQVSNVDRIKPFWLFVSKPFRGHVSNLCAGQSDYQSRRCWLGLFGLHVGSLAFDVVVYFF